VLLVRTAVNRRIRSKADYTMNWETRRGRPSSRECWAEDAADSYPFVSIAMPHYAENVSNQWIRPGPMSASIDSPENKWTSSAASYRRHTLESDESLRKLLVCRLILGVIPRWSHRVNALRKLKLYWYQNSLCALHDVFHATICSVPAGLRTSLSQQGRSCP
jgi:hypothetical protein